MSTSSTESIELKLENDVERTFFTRNLITTTVSVSRFKCENDKIIKFNSKMTAEWSYVNGTATASQAQKLIDLNRIINKNSDDISMSYDIAAFSLPPLTTHFF